MNPLSAEVGTAPRRTRYPRSLGERQIRLLILCGAAFMVVIDGTVVNVALPRIRDDLGFSPGGLAWVLNAYLLTFGGFLLLGGRLGDIVGRKRVFLTGLAVFTGASLACGLATSQGALIGARLVQGFGAAVANSGVLALIASMFVKPRDQVKALGVYGFVVSAGGAIGLLTGAVLVETVSWNWIFYINLPVGLVTFALAAWLLDEERSDEQEGADVLGALLVTAGLTLLVYLVLQTETHGWFTQRSAALAVATLILMVGFVAWEARFHAPLVPLKIFRSRNVTGANLVQLALVAGLTGTLFLGTLYMQQAMGFRALEVGAAFLPMALAIAVVSLKVVPRALRRFDAKTVVVAGLGLDLTGLGLLLFLPTDADYLAHLFPGLLLIGLGVGLGTPAALRLAIASADDGDAGLVSGIVNTMQQVGSAVGLAVVAAVAANRTETLVLRGVAPPEALAAAFRLSFAISATVLVAGLVVAVLVLRAEVRSVTASTLDDSTDFRGDGSDDLRGLQGADFVALGLGCAGMMSMLWSVALGRRAVGVELRGGPYLATMQWALRASVYRDLALIDQLMVERYGPKLLPTLADGSVLRLAHTLESGSDADVSDTADEIITQYVEGDLCGRIFAWEFIDDRLVAGQPARRVTTVEPPHVEAPSVDQAPHLSPPDMAQILAEPPCLEAPATEILILLRRYLEAIERIDLERGEPLPRVRILDSHRVVIPNRSDRRWSRTRLRVERRRSGFEATTDGRLRILVERVRELDDRGRKSRVRVPGSPDIDLGVPELFMISQGVDSDDAARLGFHSRDVGMDRGDGGPPVRAQADYLAVSTGIFIDARLRLRIASDVDRLGREYWVRQMALGREEDAQIGWVLMEIPDFRTFDPVLAGLVPAGESPSSPEWFAGHRHLLRHYYLDQASQLFGIPRRQLNVATIGFGPKMYRFVLRLGDDARVAANGVVAGDSFASGLHLTSGGPTVGLVGHAARVRDYWCQRDAGGAPEAALNRLAVGIREDSRAWVVDSLRYLAQPDAQTPTLVEGDDLWLDAADPAVAAARRFRSREIEDDHLDQWGRFLILPGRILTQDLPPLVPEAGDRSLVEVGGGDHASD